MLQSRYNFITKSIRYDERNGYNMTKKELDQYIKNVLKKAESSQEEKGNIDEIIFEFYKTVAAHYNNTVPQSIYKVFITNVPTFAHNFFIFSISKEGFD